MNTAQEPFDISRSLLFKQQGYINGRWVSASDGETMDVTNPATNAKIGEIPLMGKVDTALAVQAAKNAFKAWSSTTVKTRSERLERWYQLIMSHQDELAKIVTTEQGKVLAEAKGETVYAASFVKWFAEQARRLNGTIIPAYAPNSRIHVEKQAIGVVGAITPWNFPIAMITRKLAPALAAGCTAVIKPSELTPFTAMALIALAEEAGFPPGVINLVMGDAPSIGNELTGNPDIAKITFTGSTKVGKLLMKQSADTVKKVSLELGGNAPFIVLDDADIEAAVSGAIVSKFRNSGQTCICANRIFVQEPVYERFMTAFTSAVHALTVGDGFDPKAKLGPLINQAAVEKVERHIQSAFADGAKVLTGGRRHALGGTFFEPTILTDVPADAVFRCEETFGPVAPVIQFRTDDEVIAWSNNTRSGLAAYCYTSGAARIDRFTRELETGMVGINSGLLSTDHIPFGGVKESGIGREGGEIGIDEFIQYKYALISIPS